MYKNNTITLCFFCLCANVWGLVEEVRVRVGVGGDAPWCGGVPGVNYIPHLSIKQQSLESFLCTHKMVSVHLL